MSVHYDRARERWVVRWREAGRQRARRFASEDEARALDARASPTRVTPTVPGPAPGAAGVYAYETADGPRWRFVFRLSDGRMTSRRGFTSQSAALAARAIAVEEVRRGDVRATRDTFEEFWARLLEAKRPYVTAGTLQDYTTHGRKRLLPWFGALKLAAVDEDRIPEAYVPGVVSCLSGSGRPSVMPAESLTRQILRSHLAEGDLRPGSAIGLRADQTLLQDATGTMAFMQFEQLGVESVQVDRAVQYVDHNVVALDHKNPDDHRFLRALAARHGAYFSRPGNGISHYVHLERFGRPGDVLIGADSHTTTGGAVGMLAIGAGGLDVAVVMAGHAFELACPEVVEVYLEGELPRPWVQAKDVILELLRRLSVRGGKGRVFEFTGPGVATLAVPERGTITNMIAELGATSAVFPPDERTLEWLRGQGREDDMRELAPEVGCEYDDRVEIDLGTLGPLVARPPSPDDVVGVEEVAGTEIAQVCMGSSVNSAFVDLALPGAVLEDRGGQVVESGIDATATPGSRQIQAALVRSGVYAQLVAGGVRMLEPVCGPCVGMGQAPPSDANSLRTFNRNFRGRSGTASDCVYLCSPAVAAVSLLTGRIEDPREYGDPPALLDAPEPEPYVDDVHIFRPPPERERERIEIPRGPNIKPPPEHEPPGDSLEGRIATVQGDDLSTGDLAPDGVEVMAYRSNVPAIAEFTLRARDPDFRKRIQDWGGGLIVGGENYGQGSSREHAALAPLQLGVRAVIAKSFARIHRRNLVAQGILALTFDDPGDYDAVEVGQTWKLPRLRDELERGADTITACIDGERELTLRHDFTDKEREILLCGGLLAYLRGRGDEPATESGGAGPGTGPQREERGQGVGGRAE